MHWHVFYRKISAMKRHIHFLTLTAIILTALPQAAGPVMAEGPPATRHGLELMVNVAASGLGGILSHIEGTQAKIKVIQDFITPVRVFADSTGYFFVYNLRGICVAHATQHNLIGRNLYNLQDANGLYVIRHLISKAKEGGGFVEYNWEKPYSEEFHDKLGYVEPIPGTDLIIGSGIYLPDRH